MIASYAYFVLEGQGFDPNEITNYLNTKPSEKKRKGKKGKYIPKLKYTSWECTSQKLVGQLNINFLVNQVLAKLRGKEKDIVLLKEKLKLTSVLRIVLWIDIDEEKSTPYIGHDLPTIEFLHKTQTTTDIDIYRYNSSSMK